MIEQKEARATGSDMIQHDLILLSFVAGLGVGSGGFVLITICRTLDRKLHPETAQIWVFLWLSISFTLTLMILNLDVFVAGLWALFYIAFVTVGIIVSYLAGARVVGRPWISHLDSK